MRHAYPAAAAVLPTAAAQILATVQECAGVVDGAVVAAVHAFLRDSLGLQITFDEAASAVAVTVAAAAAAAPPPPAAAPPAAAAAATATATATAVPVDAEAQIGLLFSLLHTYSDPDAAEPPGLNVHLCAGLQAVLKMQHNRALARRVHSRCRDIARDGVPGLATTAAAARAQVPA
jgi:hypothetical protein